MKIISSDETAAKNLDVLFRIIDILIEYGREIEEEERRATSFSIATELQQVAELPVAQSA